MRNTYDAGDVVRLSVTFTLSEVVTDPTTVTLKVKKPDGTTTTYTYAAAQVTKDSTGKYHLDLSLTSAAPGLWHYRWEGTGAAQAAEEGVFVVRGTVF